MMLLYIGIEGQLLEDCDYARFNIRHRHMLEHLKMEYTIVEQTLSDCH